MTRPFFACFATLLLLASSVSAQRIELWNNPRAEAEYLAVYKTGELRPTVDLANQIEADLAAIRNTFPVVAEIRPYPVWAPGEIWLQLTPQAFDDYRNGTFTGFDPLFNELGTPELNLSFLNSSIRYMSLAFGEVYHGQRLAELFREVEGVEQAEAQWSIGSGNAIVLHSPSLKHTGDPNRKYTVVRGFGDCPSGCLDAETWSFAVAENGQVDFLGHHPGGPIVVPFTPVDDRVPEPGITVCLFTLLAIWASVSVKRRMA